MKKTKLSLDKLNFKKITISNLQSIQGGGVNTFAPNNPKDYATRFPNKSYNELLICIGPHGPHKP